MYVYNPIYSIVCGLMLRVSLIRLRASGRGSMNTVIYMLKIVANCLINLHPARFQHTNGGKARAGPHRTATYVVVGMMIGSYVDVNNSTFMILILRLKFSAVHAVFSTMDDLSNASEMRCPNG